MYFSLILYVPLVCLVCDDLARVISLLGLILCGEICSTISAHLGICVVESALVIWSEFDLWAFRRYLLVLQLLGAYLGHLLLGRDPGSLCHKHHFCHLANELVDSGLIVASAAIYRRRQS